MISEKCRTTYAKLNTFVTNVINRDVQPQIDDLESNVDSLNNSITNKLEKGDWTVLSSTESYTPTTVSLLTNNAWTAHGDGSSSVSASTITVSSGNKYFTYKNNSKKKIKISITMVSGEMSYGDEGRDIALEGEEVEWDCVANGEFDIYPSSDSVIEYSIETQTNIISSIIDVAYPIGSVYISTSTMHPSVSFGGTWEQIKDTFLLASGDTYNNGATGGSADAVVVKHNHTQNSHNHTQNSHGHTPSGGTTRRFMSSPSDCGWSELAGSNISGSGYYYLCTNSSSHNVYTETISNTVATNQAATATNQESGVDGTGKNMPPYLAVYMWQRVG